MAITLPQQRFSIDLGYLVDQAVATANSIKRKNAAKMEAEFQKAIAEGNMTYASQIKLREEQLEREKNSPFKDADTVTSLETSIKELKKMARFEKIREKYKSTLDEYIQGRGSLAVHIELLQDTLSTEVDEGMRKELGDMLTQARQEQATIEYNAIKNRALIAEKDRSLPMIESSLKELTKKQTEASASGKEDEATAWQETIVTLKQAKAKIQIENASNEINFKVARYNMKSSDKLGLLSDEISASDGSTPITVDGVGYTSQKAFWEQKRGEYIQTSYLNELAEEIKAETDRIKSTSKYGQVPAARIEAVSNFYNSLKEKDEFRSYAEVLEQKRMATVTEYANDLADSIQREFAASEQSQADVLKAETAIKNIENKFSLNLSRMPFVAAAQEASISDTLNKDLENKAPLKGGIEKATLYDKSGAPKEVVVGSFEASKLQGEGWSLKKPEAAPAPATPAAASNTPSAKPESTNTLKAYNEKGEVVYVTPGKYYRGISLTQPKQTIDKTPTPPKPEPTPAAPKQTPDTPSAVDEPKSEPNIVTLKNGADTMQVPKGDIDYWKKQGWS